MVTEPKEEQITIKIVVAPAIAVHVIFVQDYYVLTVVANVWVETLFVAVEVCDK